MATQLLHMTAPPLSSPDTMAMASSEPGLTLELSLGGSFSTIGPGHQVQQQQQKKAMEELCGDLPDQSCIHGIPSSSSSPETCPFPSSQNNNMLSFPFVTESSANTGQDDSAFDIIKRQIQAKRRQEARKRRKSLIEEKQQKKSRRDELGTSLSVQRRTPSTVAASEDSDQAMVENFKQKCYRKLVSGGANIDSVVMPPFLQNLATSCSNHAGSAVVASCVSSSYMNTASDDKPSCHSSSSELEDEDICTDEQSSVHVLHNNGDTASGCMYGQGQGQSHCHSQNHHQQQQLQHATMMMTSGPMRFSMAPYPYPMPLPWGFSLPCYMQYPHAAAAAVSNAFGSAFAAAPYQLPIPHSEKSSFSPWIPVVPVAAATVPSQLSEAPIKQIQEESGQDEDVGATQGIHEFPAQDTSSVLSVAAAESLAEEKKVSLVISSMPVEKEIMERMEMKEQSRHKCSDAVFKLDSKQIDAVLKLDTAKLGADAVLKLDTKGTLKLDAKAADVVFNLNTSYNDAVLKLDTKVDTKDSDAVLKLDTKRNDVMFELNPKGFDMFRDAAISKLDSKRSDAIDAAISKLESRGSDTHFGMNTVGKSAQLIECNDQDLKEEHENNSEDNAGAWIQLHQQEGLSSDLKMLNSNSSSAVNKMRSPKKVKVVRFNCGNDVRGERLPHLVCNEGSHTEEEERKKIIPASHHVKASTEELSSSKVSEKSSPPNRGTAQLKSINGVIGPKSIESIAKLPRVSTTGTGPNGKTVYGIMYITEDKQARLICICHGKHMSALEFVQHSDSSDVSNPERRIKINYISL